MDSDVFLSDESISESGSESDEREEELETMSDQYEEEIETRSEADGYDDLVLQSLHEPNVDAYQGDVEVCSVVGSDDEFASSHSDAHESHEEAEELEQYSVASDDEITSSHAEFDLLHDHEQSSVVSIDENSWQSLDNFNAISIEEEALVIRTFLDGRLLEERLAHTYLTDRLKREVFELEEDTEAYMRSLGQNATMKEIYHWVGPDYMEKRAEL